MKERFLAGLIACVSWGFVHDIGQAFAQSAQAVPPDDTRYQAAVREGVREFDAGNYVEARTLFGQAHALKPSARTLRGLGFCAYELKHYVQAVGELQAALAEARNPLTAVQRAEVSVTLEKAKRFVGTLVFELQPSAARVQVDGKAVAGLQVTVDAGDHTVVASAPGYHDAEQRITIEGGQSSNVGLQLSPVALLPVAAGSTALAKDAPPRDRASEGGLLTKWWFWTAAGVVVAGAVVGSALALSGGSKTAQPYAGSTGVSLKSF